MNATELALVVLLAELVALIVALAVLNACERLAWRADVRQSVQDLIGALDALTARDIANRTPDALAYDSAATRLSLLLDGHTHSHADLFRASAQALQAIQQGEDTAEAINVMADATHVITGRSVRRFPLTRFFGRWFRARPPGRFRTFDDSPHYYS